ncbi:hypothetical protein ASF00_04220 [Sphingomonas sp. Leaf34]|nr:hypothetical protein ASF00_04220 [Sphingomonas sp. Leaf34]
MSAAANCAVVGPYASAEPDAGLRRWPQPDTVINLSSSRAIPESATDTGRDCDDVDRPFAVRKMTAN